MRTETTDALREAFEIAGRLLKRGQDGLAAAILEELASDECWDATLGQSQEASARRPRAAPLNRRRGPEGDRSIRRQAPKELVSMRAMSGPEPSTEA